MKPLWPQNQEEYGILANFLTSHDCRKHAHHLVLNPSFSMETNANDNKSPSLCIPIAAGVQTTSMATMSNVKPDVEALTEAEVPKVCEHKDILRLSTTLIWS